MSYETQKLALEGLRDGDVIGFSGKGFVSDGINLATFGIPRWGLSHIGIVASYAGKRYLFESTTLNGGKPCDILDKPISGVQAHLICDILTRPGKVWHYPLSVSLDLAERYRLSMLLQTYLGTPYDYKGAARSGGNLIRIFEGILRRQDLSEFFCSELVALILTQLGVAHIMNASAQSPNSLVRRTKRVGICLPRKRIK